MATRNGKGHKHTWEQVSVTLQQGKGRVTGVSVRWSCAGRGGCKAETVTLVVVRRPGANIRPKGENPQMSAAEVKAAVQLAKTRRREMGSGSLAALEAAADLDLDTELTAEDFERPAGDGGHIRPRNVEEVKAALGLLAPLEVDHA